MSNRWTEEDLEIILKKRHGLRVVKESMRDNIPEELITRLDLRASKSRNSSNIISEKDFSSQIESLLDIGHWHWIHIRPARVLRHGKEIYETPYSGKKGFLDYLAIRPPRLLIFELKNEDGEMTPEQQGWFRLWEECQRTIIIQPLEIRDNKVNMKFNRQQKILTLPEVYLFRPSQIDEIIRKLK